VKVGSLDSLELLLNRYHSRRRGASSLRSEIFAKVDFSHTSRTRVGLDALRKGFTPRFPPQAVKVGSLDSLELLLNRYHSRRRGASSLRPEIFAKVDFSHTSHTRVGLDALQKGFTNRLLISFASD